MHLAQQRSRYNSLATERYLRQNIVRTNITNKELAVNKDDQQKRTLRNLAESKKSTRTESIAMKINRLRTRIFTNIGSIFLRKLNPISKSSVLGVN